MTAINVWISHHQLQYSSVSYDTVIIVEATSTALFTYFAPVFFVLHCFVLCVCMPYVRTMLECTHTVPYGTTSEEASILFSTRLCNLTAINTIQYCTQLSREREREEYLLTILSSIHTHSCTMNVSKDRNVCVCNYCTVPGTGYITVRWVLYLTVVLYCKLHA